ncbi:MAG: aminotransferase class IV [Verrucomicrobia bacterium]|nr:MAG: aminotransferase class IV [Verrucomicrobiota bacterium]
MSRSLSKTWRWMGGKLSPFDGTIPLADRGFRYGQHVFESVAIRDGRALLVDEHVELLDQAAKRQGLSFPRALEVALRLFAGKAHLADGMLRLYLTAGPGAPGERVKQSPCYLTWEPVHFPTAGDLRRGYALHSVELTADGATWGEKCGNYAAHLHALKEARMVGADEAIVVDRKRSVLSCAMGNLLVWLKSSKRNGAPVLCTPPASSGARRGALLTWVCGETPVEERDLKMVDLSRSLALAVTNSRLGVMPVALLDGKKLPDFNLSLSLAREYLCFASKSGQTLK